MRRTRRTQESGFVLLMAMVVLAGGLTLVSVGLTRSVSEKLAAQRYLLKQQAFHLSEAGLDRVMVELQKGSGAFPPGDGWVNIPNAGDVVANHPGLSPTLFAAWSNACAEDPADGGHWPCQGMVDEALMHDSVVNILARGVGGNNPDVRVGTQIEGVGESIQLEAGFSKAPASPFFPWAIFAKGGSVYSEITFRSTLGKIVKVDSYDSRLGAYDTNPKKSDAGDPSTWNAHIRTNDFETMSPNEAINLSACASSVCDVWGNATIGPLNADPLLAIANPAPIHGTKTYTSVITMPDVPVPSGSTCTGAGCGTVGATCPGGTVSCMVAGDALNCVEGGVSMKASEIDLTTGCTLNITGSGTAHMGQFKTQGNTTVNFDGGDMKFVLRNGAWYMAGINQKVQLLNDARVNIYVANNYSVRFGSKSQVNVPAVGTTGGTPNNFILYAPITSDLRLYTGSTYYGVVYAPLAALQFSTNIDNGKTDFFGSLVGGSVIIGEQAETYLHYDQALNPDDATSWTSASFLPTVYLRVWRYRNH
jgi:hypothetical protein